MKAPVALGLGIVAVLLSATIWLSPLGAPLGLVGLLLGILALREARRHGRRSRVAIAAIVLSALAVLALPALFTACSNGLSCV